MKKLLFLFCVATCYTQAQNVSTGPAIYPPLDPNWKKIILLSDDFDGNTLDQSKWNTQFNWLQDSIMTTFQNCSDSVISKHEGASYFKTDGDLSNHIMKTDPDGTKYLSLVTRQEPYRGMVWDWPYSQVVKPGTASIELSALSPTGFAATKWYNSKIGGTLLGTGIYTHTPQPFPPLNRPGFRQNTVFWAETAAGSNRIPVVVQVKGYNDPQGKSTFHAHELTKPFITQDNNRLTIGKNYSYDVIQGGNLILEAKGGNANDFRWYDGSGNLLGTGRWYTVSNVLVNTEIRLNNIHTTFDKLDNKTYTRIDITPKSLAVGLDDPIPSFPNLTIPAGTAPVFYAPDLEFFAESNGSLPSGMDFNWYDAADNLLGSGVKFSPGILTQTQVFKYALVSQNLVSAKVSFKVEIENQTSSPKVNQTKPIPVNFKPTWHIDHADFNYTTARIVSKRAIRYGYFEIKCRMSPSLQTGDIQGIGQSFWLWGTKSDDPANTQDDNLKGKMTEIDIFEFVSDDYKTANVESYAGGHNVHYRGNNNNIPIDGPFETPTGSTAHFDMSNKPGWHTYGAEWQPDFIQFYIDGEPTARLNRGKVKIPINDDWNNTVEVDFNPADMLFMNMIADINSPVVTTCELYGPNTAFPHFYDIDYIHVYQLQNMCNGQFIRNIPMNASQYNQSTSKVWENVQLNKGIFTFNTDAQTIIRATNSITIQPELSYPLGSELILLPMECSTDQGNFKNGLGAYKNKHNIPEPPPADFFTAKFRKY